VRFVVQAESERSSHTDIFSATGEDTGHFLRIPTSASPGLSLEKAGLIQLS